MTWFAHIALRLAFGMHTLEFAGLFPIRKWGLNKQSNYMTKACHNSGAFYTSNIRRVHSLTLIPGHAFMDGEIWKDACNKIASESPNDDPLSEEFGNRAGKEFNKLWKGIPQKEKERHFLEASKNADNMWSKTGLTNGALHGLLQTIIIQAWSAFEVLSEDLYKNSIKENLTSISEFTRKEANQHFLGFASRERIRNTYPFVFKSYNSEITRPLVSTDIDALALVRNVLVHKAGVIDQMFMDGSAMVPQLASFRSLGLGTEIQITGPWVRTLVDPVIPIGYDLLNAVDSWIFAHP